METIQGLGFNVNHWLIDPPPFKGLNIKIPTLIPIKGRGFISHGSGSGGPLKVW